MSSVPPPDETAHLDAQLMHEVTVVNAQLSCYVLRFLDTDAGRAGPMPPAEERVLADQISAAAEGIRARAERREQESTASVSDGHVDEG
jgi:hypothetical protein